MFYWSALQRLSLAVSIIALLMMLGVWAVGAGT
jgi:hypothetical protein